MAHWEELATDKQRRRNALLPPELKVSDPGDNVLDVTPIPEACGLLTAKELLITNTIDVDFLLHNLATGKWTSVEVTTAFYKRAIIAHQLVNCLTEIFIEKALTRAAQLDEHLKVHGNVVGPLHGLPVSLKDQFTLKGLEATMGYASWIGRYAEEDAVLVDILYRCGAVPFVKTNIPQSLMWVETNNLIFGRTVNPFNRHLTCGGSSGGECALVAMKGSALGIGSDLAGSIRVPAGFQGLYSLKPSGARLPTVGSLTPFRGQDSILTSLGPIANSLSGLKTLMKAVLSQSPWRKDPMVVPKTWSEQEYALVEHDGGRQLCFAIMWDDGIVVPHPPIKRALEIVQKALLHAGHKVIDWYPVKHAEISDNINFIFRAASREDLLAPTTSTGEPLLTSMVPGADRSGQAFFSNGETASAYQLWQLHETKARLRKEYLDHWEATVVRTGTGRPVDAIICPASPSTAPPHGMNRYTNYTKVWNGLDYAASTFPVTKVDPVMDTKLPAHSFLSPMDKLYYEMYEPGKFINAPVGLQLVGRTLKEEAVLAMTEIIDGALKRENGHKL